MTRLSTRESVFIPLIVVFDKCGQMIKNTLTWDYESRWAQVVFNWFGCDGLHLLAILKDVILPAVIWYCLTVGTDACAIQFVLQYDTAIQ